MNIPVDARCTDASGEDCGTNEIEGRTTSSTASAEGTGLSAAFDPAPPSDRGSAAAKKAPIIVTF